MNMKRFIAILACLVLSLSVFAVAFAGDPTDDFPQDEPQVEPQDEPQDEPHTTHTWVWNVLQPATCELNGVKRLECACGVWYTIEVIPAIGHKWVQDPSATTDPDGNPIVPTCSEPGKKLFVCENCEKFKTEVDPSKPATGNHTIKYVKDGEPATLVNTKEEATKHDATCTEAAYWNKECVYCDYKDKEFSTNVADKALGHDWVHDDEYTGEEGYRAPTCTVDGFEMLKCSRCGIKELKVIPKTGHKKGDYVDVIPATCTDDGKTAGYKCANEGCEEYYSGGEKIPKTGHNYIEKEPQVDPLCPGKDEPESTDPGTAGNKAVLKCTRCGDEKGGEEIPGVTHEWAPLNENQVVCMICGAIKELEPEEDNYCDKEETTLHEWKQGGYVVEPTCTKAGTARFTCIKCQKTKTDTAAPKGHTLVKIKTEGNKELYACYYCDYSVWKQAKHEHTWCNIRTVKPATCVTAPVMFQGCYYCDATQQKAVGSPDKTNGHLWCSIKKVDNIEYFGCYYCDATKTATIPN